MRYRLSDIIRRSFWSETVWLSLVGFIIVFGLAGLWNATEDHLLMICQEGC